MDAKKIIAGGFIGGIALLIVNFVISALIMLIAPYDVLALGGMRPADDPLVLFFFAYPFVLSFAAAILFDLVKDALQGPPSSRGMMFGAALILIYTIPSVFIAFASMNYPVGFYLEDLLFGIIGFPLIGAIYALIWEHL
ncbi:hypothetical protein [Methanoculleus sp. 7T]|uniref:hypothetical protein n=1 Tax=Methanoculleus sp. 7T TaxID=2937282 RepID=UPI0020BD9D92|nr:hypothetical protein [Methanoculleus sp. 7T]MCK8518273.1 hypothetical protein [Methanoculleus sp. 7T]